MSQTFTASSLAPPTAKPRLDAYLSKLDIGGALIVLDRGVVTSSDDPGVIVLSVFVVFLMCEDGSVGEDVFYLDHTAAREAADKAFTMFEADYIVDLTEVLQ